MQAAEWRQDLERNLWSGDYLDSSAYARFLADEFGELKTLLTDLSLAKK